MPDPQNLGIQNEMAIGVTPDPFPPTKGKKAVCMGTIKTIIAVLNTL